MKKFTLTFSLLIIAIAVVAQTPKAFKYQAVARESNGNIIANGESPGIELFIKIYRSLTGMDIYIAEIGTKPAPHERLGLYVQWCTRTPGIVYLRINMR